MVTLKICRAPLSAVDAGAKVLPGQGSVGEEVEPSCRITQAGANMPEAHTTLLLGLKLGP